MTQIFTFDEFVTENQQEVLYQMEKTRDAQEKVPTDPNEALVRLYNGIKNDYSIQRYSLGWSDVTKAIEKKLRGKIKKDDEQSFEDHLVTDAVAVADEKLKAIIVAFGRELNMNMETLRDKQSGSKSIHRG